jgi:hypothetical protein
MDNTLFNSIFVRMLPSNNNSMVLCWKTQHGPTVKGSGKSASAWTLMGGMSTWLTPLTLRVSSSTESQTYVTVGLTMFVVPRNQMEWGQTGSPAYRRQKSVANDYQVKYPESRCMNWVTILVSACQDDSQEIGRLTCPSLIAGFPHKCQCPNHWLLGWFSDRSSVDPNVPKKRLILKLC